MILMTVNCVNVPFIFAILMKVNHLCHATMVSEMEKSMLIVSILILAVKPNL